MLTNEHHYVLVVDDVEVAAALVTELLCCLTSMQRSRRCLRGPRAAANVPEALYGVLFCVHVFVFFS